MLSLSILLSLSKYNTFRNAPNLVFTAFGQLIATLCMTDSNEVLEIQISRGFLIDSLSVARRGDSRPPLYIENLNRTDLYPYTSFPTLILLSVVKSSQNEILNKITNRFKRLKDIHGLYHPTPSPTKKY